VVVYALSRFTRSITDQSRTIAELQLLGITLHSVSERLEDSPSGRLARTMIGGFSEFDNDIRKERTTSGMKSALLAGRWPRGSPLGYLKSGKRSPTLVIDPVRGPLIRQGFEMMATGSYKPTEALRKLTDQGLRTKRGNVVSDTTFRDLLRNELFIGMMVDRKWKLRILGDFESLVPPTLFRAVQRVLEGRRPSATAKLRDNPAYPLRGLVRCELCGNSLTASASTSKNGNKYPYYHCLGCGIRIPKAVFHQRFVELLASVRPNPDYLPLLHEVVREAWRAQEANSTETRASFKRQIAALESRRSRLLEKWVDNQVIERDYREMSQQLDEQIRKLTERDAYLQSESLDIDEAVALSEFIVMRSADIWNTLSLGGKQRLQAAIFPSGITTDRETYRTPDTFLFYRDLTRYGTEKRRLVDQTGIEPVTS
jgi:site-specific DNA recombinase